MWTLRKKFRFEASHVLPFHDGKCSRLHGHSWNGTVYVLGESLIEYGAKRGMVMDYDTIKEPLQRLVDDKLDHYHLNDLMLNPTSENLARWIYDMLKLELPSLIGVEIEETCTTSCLYIEKEALCPSPIHEKKIKETLWS